MRHIGTHVSVHLFCAGLLLFATGAQCTEQPEQSQSVLPATTVSFADQIQPIFDQHCIRCHVTGGFANQSGIPLRLVQGESYLRLVNQQSVQDPNWTLVKPGDSTNSLLYQKVSQPTPPVGLRMPWDGHNPPSEESIEHIKTWIDEGAENN